MLFFFSPEFNFSSTLVNSQLVILPPVGILNLVMFISILICHCLLALVLKSPDGEWPITYTYIQSGSLRRRTNTQNVSFRISLRWPIHIINPIDKTKLPQRPLVVMHFSLLCYTSTSTLYWLGKVHTDILILLSFP